MDRDLIKYLPYEIRKYKDYQVITDSESPEFTRVFKVSREILDESFIESSTEYGVSRLEKMLKIYPHPTDTLNDRKLRLIIWWNNQVPYTWRVLIEKLNAICGVGKYEVTLFYQVYQIELKTKLTTSSQYEDLIFLLGRIIPCNMEVLSSNTLLNRYNKNVYYGVGLVERKKYIITHDFKDHVIVDLDRITGNAINEYKANKVITKELI